jgi:cob(I)alamin adenosyltransferase
MKIYTKTGDTGKTSLAMGGRVLKSDLRVEMYGTCDELNSTIGLVLSYTPKDNILVPYLNMTQNLLFEIGSELSGFKSKNSEISAIVMGDIDYLEKAIDEIEEKLEPLKSFIHVSRTVCRRLERLMVHAHSNGVEVLSNTLMYINRLSDFLFVAARYANFEVGFQEPKWITRVK